MDRITAGVLVDDPTWNGTVSLDWPAYHAIGRTGYVSTTPKELQKSAREALNTHENAFTRRKALAGK